MRFIDIFYVWNRMEEEKQAYNNKMRYFDTKFYFIDVC